MFKGLSGWARIFLTGLAVGIVASRLWLFSSPGDSLTNAALVEAGLVVALALLAGGAAIGARRGRLGAVSAHVGRTSAAALSPGNHLTHSIREGKWVIDLRNLGAYDSVQITVPVLKAWRIPLTIPWGSSQLAAAACASVLLAALGQYTFTFPNTSGRDGVVLYVVAMLLFIPVARNLEARNSRPFSASTAVEKSGPAGRNRIRNVLIVIALVVTCILLTNPDLPRWDHDQTTNSLLWMLALLSFVAAFLPWNSLQKRVPLRPRSMLEGASSFIRLHAVEMCVVSAIIVVAFISRAYDLSHIPRAFGGDEGEMGSSSLDVLGGKLINPFITGWFSHPTLFFFLQAFSMSLFGETVFGIRLLSVIAGVLTVFVSYWLVRQLFDRRLALVTAVIMAVYSAHIHYSRLAVNNIEDGLIASLVLFLTYRGLVSRKAIYFAAAGLSLGFGLYFYQGARIVPIIVVLLLAYLLVSDFKLIRSNISNLALMGAGALIAAGPLLLFFYTQPKALTSRLAEVNILTNGFLARASQSPGGAGPFLLEQVRRSFLAFNLVPETSMFYYVGVPMLDPLSGVLFVFGLAYSIFHVREKPYFFMLLWFFVGEILGGVLIADPPTSARLQIIFVPVIFFVSLGLTKLAQVAARLWPGGVKFAWIVSAAVIVLIAYLNVKTYFVDYSPKEIFGGDPALAATEMGEYFLAYPRPFRAYVLGDVAGFIHIGTLRFMVPHLDALSVDDKLQGAPGFVDVSRDALFVVFPTRNSEFDLIQQSFPGGKRIDFPRPDGRLLFFLYEVRDT